MSNYIMPGEDEDFKRLKQLIYAKFLPVLRAGRREKLLEAYNEVKGDAFNEKLRFPDPVSEFWKAFEEAFNDMGKKLGKDLSSEKDAILTEITYDGEMGSFRSEWPSSPIVEKPVGGRFEAKVDERIDRFISEIGGEAKLKYFSGEPRYDEKIKGFMRELGEMYGEEGRSPKEEELEARFKGRVEDARYFMRHFRVFEEACERALERRSKREELERISEEEEVILLTEEIAEEFRKPPAEAKRIPFEKMMKGIEEAWGKPLLEFKKFIRGEVDGWRRGIVVPNNAGKELTPFSPSEAKGNEEALKALTNFRDLIVTYEGIAKDKRVAKNASEEDKQKAEYVLKVMSLLKFNASLEIARIKLRQAMSLPPDEFEEALRGIFHILNFNTVSPINEAAEKNSEKLNEFLFSIYKMSMQGSAAGDDRMKKLEDLVPYEIDEKALFNMLSTHTKERLGEVGGEGLGRAEHVKKIDNVLSGFEANINRLLKSPISNEEKWLKRLDVLLTKEYNETTKLKEEEGGESRR